MTVTPRAGCAGLRSDSRSSEKQFQVKTDERGGLTMYFRGLCPKSNKTKVSYLIDLALESNAPFIALQETHLFKDILDPEVQISGQTLYISDRLGGRTHGGVAVYIRDDLTVRELFKYSNNCCESIILEIKELEMILINM